MRNLTRNEAARFLAREDRFLILTHRRPDGDTLGSAAALCRGLRLLGKTAWVLRNPDLTPRFAFLVEGLTIPQPPENSCLLCVDVASPGMLPPQWSDLGGSVCLRIDHHASAASFTRTELVEPDSASCAEIIWELLKLLQCPADTAVYSALYVGVSTDTGCFRYANTTEHTFLAAAACARGGVDIFGLNQTLFETNTLGRLRIQGWIVENMTLFSGGAMAVCAIPREIEQSLGVTEDDMDNISNFPRTVYGVKVAATLRQTGGGETKLSVRAIPGYDATLVAAAFGGGGHRGAAGASMGLPLEAAAAAVQKVMEEVYPWTES